MCQARPAPTRMSCREQSERDAASAPLVPAFADAHGQGGQRRSRGRSRSMGVFGGGRLWIGILPFGPMRHRKRKGDVLLACWAWGGAFFLWQLIVAGGERVRNPETRLVPGLRGGG